ncbi:MAG: glycosyltransferase family 1 protein [Patescibacteria group bacterium]
MRIGIDASAITKTKPTGVEIATRDLLLSLVHLPTEDHFILYTPSPLGPDWAKSKQVTIKVLPAKQRWTQTILGPTANQDELDIFFSPSYLPPFNLKVPSVVTIHGLEFFKHPYSYTVKNWILSTLTVILAKYKASHIVAVSNNIKRDLQTMAQIPANRISVVYNALSPVLLQRIKLAKRSSGQPPYILAVGRIEPRKNTIRLIKAFAKISEKHPDLTLHLAGFFSTQDYQKRVEDLIKQLGLHHKVVFLGHLDHQQLGVVYKNATALTLVSLDEGFGIPVLEGFAAEIPVVTSEGSATEEVADGAAELVDPKSITSIATGLDKVLSDPHLARNYVTQGQYRLAQFSWDKSAKQLLEVFHRV